MYPPEKHHYAGRLIRIFIERIGDPRVKRPRIIRYAARWEVEGSEGWRRRLSDLAPDYDCARDEALAEARRAIDRLGASEAAA